MIYITYLAGVGGTFLDWSIHYLAGKKNYYRIEDGIDIKLCDQPLTEINAHNHKKNHMNLFLNVKEKLIEIDKKILEQKNKIISINNTLENLPHDEVLSILQSLKSYTIESKKKLIYINKNTKFPVSAERFLSMDELIHYYKNFERAQNHQFNIFPNFKNCKNLSDIREILSYRIRKMIDDNQKINDEVNKIFISNDYILNIKNTDLYTEGFNTLQTILNFLNLSIDKNRIDHWKFIYNIWSKNFKSRMDFYNDLPNISRAIVENISYSLEKYNMSISEEAFLINYLMTTYKKKLKIKNLSKFPKNTQLLHQFL